MQSLTLSTPTVTRRVVLHIDATTSPGDPAFDYTAISDVDVEGQ
jgi:hypothetical protein